MFLDFRCTWENKGQSSVESYKIKPHHLNFDCKEGFLTNWILISENKQL